MNGCLRAAVVFFAAFAVAFSLRASGVVFPEYAGVLNVRDSRFGAKGDGLTDDTAAIQKALSQGMEERRIVYLPDGIYLVSDTLQGDGGGCDLQGQSRSGTIVRLAKSAPGFGDDSKPNPLLRMGNAQNLLCDFAVETGDGNPGAIGIDFVSTRRGAIRRVDISGSGWCGLRARGGEGFVRDVSIRGFRQGIHVEGKLCQMAFENISLSASGEVGMEIDDALACVRNLKSSEIPRGIRVRGDALIDLLGATLTTKASSKQAIEVIGLEPRLFARRIETEGYNGILLSRGMLYSIPAIQEWCSDDASGYWGARASALDLPVEDAPEFVPEDEDWADAGEPDGKDDTARIQAALDVGKAGVFLRHGVYRIANTLRVPPSARVISGAGASIETTASFPEDRALFMFQSGTRDDTTQVERIAVHSRGTFLVNHADARTLVLRDLELRETPAYRNREESGKLFVENVAAPIHILHPTRVWMRGFSTEGAEGIVNNGGTVWALGCALRSSGTLIENRNGGSLEAWGVLMRSTGGQTDAPAVLNDRSKLCLSLVEAPQFYDVVVHDDQGGMTKEYRPDELPSRGEGELVVPLFISSPEPTGKRQIE